VRQFLVEHPEVAQDIEASLRELLLPKKTGAAQEADAGEALV
jgi:hypothetical protein